MLSERKRLLLLLVLLSVVATAGWKTALASGKTVPSTVHPTFASVAKSPVVPTSGEPDVGQTPRPTLTKGSLFPAPRGEGGGSQPPSADSWFRWIFRTWTMRDLGSR
jgi:hypothetical protein